jgi:hypothetical protein
MITVHAIHIIYQWSSNPLAHEYAGGKLTASERAPHVLELYDGLVALTLSPRMEFSEKVNALRYQKEVLGYVLLSVRWESWFCAAIEMMALYSK